jgi:hypothetical protein
MKLAVIATWADAIPDWFAYAFLLGLVLCPILFVVLIVKTSDDEDQ